MGLNELVNSIKIVTTGNRLTLASELLIANYAYATLGNDDVPYLVVSFLFSCPAAAVFGVH